MSYTVTKCNKNMLQSRIFIGVGLQQNRFSFAVGSHVRSRFDKWCMKLENQMMYYSKHHCDYEPARMIDLSAE